MANNDDHEFTGEAEILKRAADEYERSNPEFAIDSRKTALLVWWTFFKLVGRCHVRLPDRGGLRYTHNTRRLALP